MKIGVDYYPEHWDEKLWVQDADLMKKTGVKVVRLADFAWSRLEPQEGIFDFEWLDRAITLFEERGIEVILCTPTNCPPIWMYQKYPETIQEGRDSKKSAIGLRGHRCIVNPTFRKLSARIIEKLTRHYANSKNVVAWQIDNELESNFCTCDYCVQDYHKWLKDKYGSLENINLTYGNNVWSGEYSDFEQITPPLGTFPYAWFNPAYTLDYYRFASDSMVEYVNFQTEIIRKNCPDTVITTNTWLSEKVPDFYKAYQNLDVVSYDNYPTTRIPENEEEIYSHAFHLDLMRGIKNKNFWIMEQLSGTPGCWMPMLPTPRPGMIKGYSLQAIAHGVDMVIHFRWRTAVTGAEMFWHGLIDHSNIPGRRFEEFTDLCSTVNELQDLDGSIISNECAIIYSSDQEYALKIQPQTESFHYYNQIKSYHHALTSVGVGVDIINQYADFSNYKLIVAPTLFVTDESVVQRLYEFTENGGTVIITNRSGVKDINNNCKMEALPTAYRELVGAYVTEYDAIGRDVHHVRMNDGNEYEVTQWCDILETETSKVLASYSDSFYSGKAAVTKNRYGKGCAYYVGTIGKKAFYKNVITNALEATGIDYMTNLPEGVELTIRKKDNQFYYFIFNNTTKHQTMSFQDKRIELAPFEMQIKSSN